MIRAQKSSRVSSEAINRFAARRPQSTGKATPVSVAQKQSRQSVKVPHAPGPRDKRKSHGRTAERAAYQVFRLFCHAGRLAVGQLRRHFDEGKSGHEDL